MSDKDPVIPWEQVGKKEAAPAKRAGMIIDLRRCVGCHSCTVACKTEHAVPLGSFRNRTHYVQRPDRDTLAFIPMMCMHCQDAPCIPACPCDAMTRLADGRVVVKEDRCDASRECISACPYDAISINPQKNKAEKCDLCEHRTGLGMDPACVEACPTDALRYGDLDAPDSAVAGLAARQQARGYKEQEGTRPSVLYIGHETWMEAKAPGVQRGPGEEGIIYE